MMIEMTAAAPSGACPAAPRPARPVHALAAGAMLGLLIGIIAPLGLDVMRQLDALTATSDTVPWEQSPGQAEPGAREAAAGLPGRLALVATGLAVLLLASLAALARCARDMRCRTLELQRTGSRLSATVASVRDAVIVADAGGRILDVNPAAETIFGHRRDEILGRPLDALILPGHVRPALHDGMDRGREAGARRLCAGGRVEVAARRRSGAVFPADLSLGTADSGTGPITVLVLRDISARKAAEAELTRARDKAQACERARANMLAVMSHEMRTPLNAILGMMELMRDGDLDPGQREHLSIMDAAGRLLLHHVNDVLELSHPDTGRTEAAAAPFDLGALLDETVSMHRALAAIHDNRLALDAGAGIGGVIGDAPRLRRVLVNLIGNALKFTRAGMVTVQAVRPGGGDIVEIAVRDTGCGISAADRARIFEAFFTADASYCRETGGTGLGLAVTARLVRQLGGEIAVDSRPGAGSVFTLRLPLPAAAATGAPIAEQEAETGADAPLDILLVEDNRVNRRVARAMLERLGHRVTEAADGLEGVERAFQKGYDAILMDISMPRLDGVEATRRIRLGGRSRHARIIALTAHDMPEEVARFRAAGMDAVGCKPVSRAQLHGLLAACRKAQPAPAGAARVAALSAG